MARAPLEGVRILDFTWAWAGPQATLMLGMLGADIIKVESHRRLDHTRMRSLMTGPTLAGPDHSVIFSDLNVNKLGVTINLSQPQAADIVKRIVHLCDVVMENMRPGVMERLGIGYEALRQVKPDIIMLSSSAVGNTGPERSYVGYAPTFAALSGLTHITGHPDGPPMPLSGAVDLRVGTTSAFAILAALCYRQRTGRGQYIDLSSTEAVSALIGEKLLEYSITGHPPTREGNRDPIIAPHNCYPCQGENQADAPQRGPSGPSGWMSIAVADDEEWRALCRVVDDDRLNDERFGDAYGRWCHQDQIDAVISEWTRDRGREEAAEALQKAGVAAMPVLDGRALAQDVQVKARGLLQKVNHPLIGERLEVGPPWKFSRTPAGIRRPSPLLGEHNEYVLRDLAGMSQEEIDRLSEEGVLH
jgi:benzylsuccinate CoA-transferase BbsF subunit